MTPRALSHGLHEQPVAARSGPGATTRVRELAVSEWPCVVAVCWFAAVLLLVAPALITQDTWLTLVSGREIGRIGLPQVETLTVFARGADWVDQQWLAQVVYYGAWRVGGLTTAFALHVGLVVAAIGAIIVAARRRGGSARTVGVLVPALLLAAPSSWSLRAQTLAVVLFAALLALLVEHRSAARPRVVSTLGILVLWANVHGSVLVGVVAVVVYAASMLAKRRSPRWPATALLVGAPAAVLASPYAASLPSYYHLMLVDPPFGRLVLEWQRTGVEARTALFWLALAATAAIIVLRPRLFAAHEATLLVLLALLSVVAVRNVVWFVLAAAVFLPQAVDSVAPRRWSARQVAATPRIGVVATASVVALAIVSLATLNTRAASTWPDAAIRKVDRAASADSRATVYANERLADWLLWRLPSLRGRLVFDARLELLARGQIDRIVSFQSGSEPWRLPPARARVVVLSPENRDAIENLVSRHGYRLAAADDRAVVVIRPAVTPA